VVTATTKRPVIGRYNHTTGDCTLVMHHPINGLTYLFTSRDGISPALYVQILETPRDHNRLRAMHQNERQIVLQLPAQNGSNSNRSNKKKKDSRKETKTKSNIAVGQTAGNRLSCCFAHRNSATIILHNKL
jgi:hypothetical protein